MKTLAKEVLRWCVIAASGGYGLWHLFEAGRAISHSKGGWLNALFLVIFFAIIAAPLLAVAYLCLRRQYGKLFLGIGAMGSIVIFFGLAAVPSQLGVFEFLDRHSRENSVYGFLGLPLALFVLLGPIYAAVWFYRLCSYLAYRGSPGYAKRSSVKTRSTRWLVWLGIACMILPAMIGMLIALYHIAHSPPASIPNVLLDNLHHLIIDLAVIGSLLFLLGLVRRQPISKPREETPSADALNADGGAIAN